MNPVSRLNYLTSIYIPRFGNPPDLKDLLPDADFDPLGGHNFSRDDFDEDEKPSPWFESLGINETDFSADLGIDELFLDDPYEEFKNYDPEAFTEMELQNYPEYNPEIGMWDDPSMAPVIEEPLEEHESTDDLNPNILFGNVALAEDLNTFMGNRDLMDQYDQSRKKS